MRVPTRSKKLSAATLIGFPLVMALASLAGCDSTSSSVVGTGGSSVVVDNPSDYTAEHTVCDPFANNPGHIGSDLSHGLVASLAYLPDSAPRAANLSQMAASSVAVDATLFFDNLYVPTRLFDLGFTTESGNLLVNQDGTKLYEYFSVHFDSRLQLAASDAEGNYQFALIADDGAVMKADLGSGFQTIVNDDGAHPSEFVNATQAIHLTHGATVPIQVDYFQGPRYHIALVMMWRPMPTSGNVNDPLNGQNGNSLFFDYNTVPSNPMQAFKDLQSRGWRVVPAANFLLPAAVASNPCHTGAPSTSITNASSTPFSNMQSGQFVFTSSDSSATFNCSLDSSALASCTSPYSYSGLADGQHTFSVFATSSSGVPDPTGASYSWTVDTTPPMVTAFTTSVTSSSIAITWTTDEMATTSLFWGLGSATGNVVADDGVYAQSHALTLDGLTPFTIYSFVFQGHDQAGNACPTSPRHVVSTTP